MLIMQHLILDATKTVTADPELEALHASDAQFTSGPTNLADRVKTLDSQNSSDLSRLAKVQEEERPGGLADKDSTWHTS